MNPHLAAWSSFYVITGSSAAALTGLMFVVITLVAGQERLQNSMQDGVETFSSPTVVHFCAALLVSAILAAPWQTLLQAAIVLTLAGLYGTFYAIRVVLGMLRMKRRSAYVPGSDDWMWYAIMPLLAYLGIVGAAIALTFAPFQALFALAGATITLIFLGIRNAWDTVTYIAVLDKDQSKTPD